MLNSFGEGKLLTENLPVDCGGVTLVERPAGGLVEARSPNLRGGSHE